MAGQWIAWCKGLSRKPEVLAIGKATRKTRREVAAILMEFWEWADDQTADGFVPGAGPSELADMISGTDAEFWLEVERAGWLVFKANGVELPRFSRWLGQSAKKRLNTVTRQARWRRAAPREAELPFTENAGSQGDATVDAVASSQASAHVDAPVDAPNPLEPSTREREREREEKIPNAARLAAPPRPAKDPALVKNQAAIAAWQDAWKAKYGERYSLQGKDTDAIRWMLGEIGWDLPRWRQIVADYLSRRDNLAASKRHDVGFLRSQFNTFKGQPKAQPPPAAGDVEDAALASYRRRVPETEEDWRLVQPCWTDEQIREAMRARGPKP